ncbi:hypothetical protein [Asanoa sp. NPDC050611]|uniref:hypothetical protein n=1 Tax=Asanoa sp. NPDC050611 TaxID=3157098 RepID=UPI0033F9B21D
MLDTSAVLAYAEGSNRVGVEIVEVADEGLEVVLPASCLATAYQLAASDRWPLLDILSSLPQVVVKPLDHEICAVLGGWARTLGMDLAHAAIESAGVPPVPIFTDRRRQLEGFLPKGWPIVDL